MREEGKMFKKLMAGSVAAFLLVVAPEVMAQVVDDWGNRDDRGNREDYNDGVMPTTTSTPRPRYLAMHGRGRSSPGVRNRRAEPSAPLAGLAI
jgi:hypothetical protein